MRLYRTTILALISVALAGAACRNMTEPITGGAAKPSESKRAKIRLAWTSESSQNLYGYNIYRGNSPDGKDGWVRVNPTPILAADGGTSSIPHDYEVIDTHESLEKGKEYWYWMEGLNADGTKFKAWWPPSKVVANTGMDEEFKAPR